MADKFYFAKIDVPIMMDEQRDGHLAIIKTNEVIMDGLPWRYYAMKGKRIIWVMENGQPIELLPQGQWAYIRTSWADGLASFVLPENSGKRHRMFAVRYITDNPYSKDPVEFINLSELIEKAPGDRPGGARGDVGRKPSPEPMIAVRSYMPVSLAAFAEHLGGTTSAGIRKALAQALDAKRAEMQQYTRTSIVTKKDIEKIIRHLEGAEVDAATSEEAEMYEEGYATLESHGPEGGVLGDLMLHGFPAQEAAMQYIERTKI